MATRVILTPAAAELPGTGYAQFAVTNNHPVLDFDGAADESAYWTLIAPQGLTGTLTLEVFYIMLSATTGTVRFEALVEAVTPGDATDIDAGDSFDTTNSNGGTVPATAGHVGQISITLTAKDSIAAGDLVRILLRRDADGTTGTDDVVTDCRVLAVELRDAA